MKSPRDSLFSIDKLIWVKKLPNKLVLIMDV